MHYSSTSYVPHSLNKRGFVRSFNNTNQDEIPAPSIEETNRRNRRLSEKLAIAYHAAPILIIALFVPIPASLALCAVYLTAIGVFRYFRKEIRSGLFKLFDKVALLLGFPEPPAEDRDYAASEPGTGHRHIQHRLRSNSEPILTATQRPRRNEVIAAYRQVIEDVADDLREIQQAGILSQNPLWNEHTIRKSDRVLCRR